MTIKKFRFIVRWILPSVISMIAFLGVFFYNLVLRMPEVAKEEPMDIVLAFLLTAIGGLFAGLGYSIYRPYFRKFDRWGDFWTGMVSLVFYTLAIYNISQYYNFHQGLKDGLGYLVLFMGVIGGFGGWYMEISKLENSLIDWFLKQLVEDEP